MICKECHCWNSHKDYCSHHAPKPKDVADEIADPYIDQQLAARNVRPIDRLTSDDYCAEVFSSDDLRDAIAFGYRAASPKVEGPSAEKKDVVFDPKSMTWKSDDAQFWREQCRLLAEALEKCRTITPLRLFVDGWKHHNYCECFICGPLDAHRAAVVAQK